eukprot:SAG22_NODE_11771_length_470_cov_0.730458_1_plen_58_part_00
MPAALAVVLPLLDGVLPRDNEGCCIVPHPHKMERQAVPDEQVHIAVPRATASLSCFR